MAPAPGVDAAAVRDRVVQGSHEEPDGCKLDFEDSFFFRRTARFVGWPWKSAETSLLLGDNTYAHFAWMSA